MTLAVGPWVRWVLATAATVTVIALTPLERSS